MWEAIAFAIAFVTAASAITWWRIRRGRKARSGLTFFLLGLAVLSLLVAYEAYFPSCPRGWWC